MTDHTVWGKKIIPMVDRLIDQGLTDKNEIITRVVEEFGVARPIVRRVMRDMRNEMLEKVKILQSEIPLPE